MRNRNNTKKGSKKRNAPDILPEYDFSKGVRGKHALDYAEGTNIVMLEPDVASEFRTSEGVNEALRAISKLIQKRRSRAKQKTA
jgi:hypothetical protein